MKIAACILIMILSAVVGAYFGGKGKDKLDALREVSRFFYSFKHYVLIEHSGLIGGIERYAGAGGSFDTLLLKILKRTKGDKKCSACAAYSELAEEELYMLSGEQVRYIGYFFRLAEEMDRETVITMLENAEKWAEEQCALCVQSDVKKGTLIKKTSVLIGIIAVILLI